MFSDLLAELNFIYIFLASFLFIAGIYTAPFLVEKETGWLLAYPRWVGRLTKKYIERDHHFTALFIVIVILNNLSLFSGFLSGYLIVLPFLLCFFTGFNVAVLGYDLLGWQGIWHMLVNPVAWLEFPAAWLSFAMGFRLAVAVAENGFTAGVLEFQLLLPLYLKYVFTLLIIAGILESLLIFFARRHQDHD
ncbi:MAG: stage II sporulation protein M [Calditrichia bacterium]